MSFVWDDGVSPTFTYWGKDQPDDVLGKLAFSMLQVYSYFAAAYGKTSRVLLIIWPTLDIITN